jgi:hypothetical protein
LKEAEQKAIEWEKKCMTANKNVDGNLTELAGLKKENNDLKTKKSQLNSQVFILGYLSS